MFWFVALCILYGVFSFYFDMLRFFTWVREVWRA